MAKEKNKAKFLGLILTIICLLIIVVTSIEAFVFNRELLKKTQEVSLESDLANTDTTYINYKVEQIFGNTYKILVKISNPNGIENIAYKNSIGEDITLICDNKLEIDIDYIANPDTSYYFTVKQVGQTEKIKELLVEKVKTIIADEYIYVDSQNGNDETGNGSEILPYKSLLKVANVGLNPNITYGIVLGTGNYELDDEMFNTGCTNSVKIIGQKSNTILNLKQIGTDYTSGGNGQYTIEIYKMICTSTESTLNHINTINSMNFYNVVFNLSTTYGHGYIAPRGGNVTLNNCTLTSNVPAFIRTSMTSGYVRLTNCYGGFNSGYATQQSFWNYATNVITSLPVVNSTIYQIEDTLNSWRDNGTGYDIDGTVSDIGVYGGNYSWNY